MDDTKRYNTILQVLSEVAHEHNVNEEILKQIYEMERGVVHLRSRNHINEELRRIMFGNECDA